VRTECEPCIVEYGVRVPSRPAPFARFELSGRMA